MPNAVDSITSPVDELQIPKITPEERRKNRTRALELLQEASNPGPGPDPAAAQTSAIELLELMDVTGMNWRQLRTNLGKMRALLSKLCLDQPESASMKLFRSISRR